MVILYDDYSGKNRLFMVIYGDYRGIFLESSWDLQWEMSFPVIEDVAFWKIP